MNKHTPGPWSYTVDVSHAGGSDPVNMVRYRIYAQGHKRGQTHDFPCLGTLNGAGASEADAALIAAAPELLEVLNKTLQVVSKMCLNADYGKFGSNNLDRPPGIFVALRSEIAAAIAKAEGR